MQTTPSTATAAAAARSSNNSGLRHVRPATQGVRLCVQHPILQRQQPLGLSRCCRGRWLIYCGACIGWRGYRSIRGRRRPWQRLLCVKSDAMPRTTPRGPQSRGTPMSWVLDPLRRVVLGLQTGRAVCCSSRPTRGLTAQPLLHRRGQGSGAASGPWSEPLRGRAGKAGCSRSRASQSLSATSPGYGPSARGCCLCPPCRGRGAARAPEAAAAAPSHVALRRPLTQPPPHWHAPRATQQPQRRR